MATDIYSIIFYNIFYQKEGLYVIIKVIN